MHKQNHSIKGINVYGYLNELSGLSESARSNIKSLLSIGVKLNIKSFSYDNTANDYKHAISSNEEFAINLVHININFIEKFIDDVGTDFLKNKYNIAYWAWEFSEPPLDIATYLSLFDEIWVPSDFCVNAFTKMATIPVIKIPHAIPNRKELITHSLNPENNKKSFTFLTVFDSLSSVERKNPQATVKAFIKAFSKDTSVKLIIKTHNLKRFKNMYAYFLNITKRHENITLINEKISSKELASLYNLSDAYISLHRSEGFGLTLAEAMSYGKITIATGFSGSLEFMNINNSFLLPYSIIETTQDYGLTKKGYQFADVDIDEAVKTMQYIVNNYDMLNDKRVKAKETIQSKYSFENIGSLMKNRLLLIEKNIVNGINEKNIEKEKIIMKLTSEKNNLNREIEELSRKIKKYEKNIFIKIKKLIKKL